MQPSIYPESRLPWNYEEAKGSNLRINLESRKWKKVIIWNKLALDYKVWKPQTLFDLRNVMKILRNILWFWPRYCFGTVSHCTEFSLFDQRKHPLVSRFHILLLSHIKHHVLLLVNPGPMANSCWSFPLLKPFSKNDWVCFYL